MAEGKTLAPTVICTLCDGGSVIKFCVNCQQELCLRCCRAHSKIQSTSHHKLVAIADRDKSTGTIPTRQAYCSDHTSKSLNTICQQCLSAICDICADRDHKSHKLLRTNLNTTLLQRISAQKVPEFMELLHQLENEQDGSPVKLDLYKTARDMVKGWRDRLRKIVEQDSDNLLKQIEQEIQKQEKLLADITTNLKDAVTSTDRQMSVLSDARKIDDPATLLCNIHEGGKIIQKARALLSDIESTRRTYTIEDILPFTSELNNVEKSLHAFLTMTKLSDDASTQIPNVKHPKAKTQTSEAAPGKSYSTMTKISGHHIAYHKGRRFIISESSQKNSQIVVVYHVYTPDIHVFRIHDTQMKKFTCAKEICRMTTLTDEKHVIRDSENYNIHFLDGNFNIVSTLNNDPDKYIPRGVLALASDTFILSEHFKFGRTKFSEVTVSQTNMFNKKKLYEVDFYNSNDSFSLSSDRKNIVMTSNVKVIHTVDLATGQATKLDLRSHIGDGIYYLCVDENNQLLVGDLAGNVHLVSSDKYDRELKNMKGEGAVGGVSIRGDKVVVVAGEFINIYQ